MRFLLEALPGLVLIGLAVVAARSWRASWRRRRALERARWTAQVRSVAEHRVVVEVVRPGEATQVVAELDPAGATFDEELFQAQARAENLAATLNATRPRGRSG